MLLIDLVKIPIGYSLGTVALILIISVILSILYHQRKASTHKRFDVDISSLTLYVRLC